MNTRSPTMTPCLIVQRTGGFKRYLQHKYQSGEAATLVDV